MAFLTPLRKRWRPGRRAAALASLTALAGCVDAYLPEVVATAPNYLVVDGFINGNGITRIKLSRTENVAATSAPPPEKGAKLVIADDTGQRYPLTEKSSGFYLSDSLVLPAGRRYQLRITTAGAGAPTYASDPLLLKVTPPIDAVSWKLAGEQVQLSLSTHDASQQSRYYRWGVIETWEFRSAFQSFIEYNRQLDAIVNRTTPIYTCWRTERSSAVRQATTAQLSQDALPDVALLNFPTRAERVKIRYSVLVSQYAETAEEFAYNDLLRKNTEAVGTVNDPLPVQLTGNVHRVGQPGEPVLGFVGAHTVQYKRLFISKADLPPRNDWDYDTPYLSCTTGDEVLVDSRLKFPRTAVFQDVHNTPIDYLGNESGYTGSTTECVDCRVRGSNVKPDFW